MSETPYKTITGPNGAAEVVEVITESPGWRIAYEVRFKDQQDSFETEGEAVVRAYELSGTAEPFRAAGLTF